MNTFQRFIIHYRHYNYLFSAARFPQTTLIHLSCDPANHFKKIEAHQNCLYDIHTWTFSKFPPNNCDKKYLILISSHCVTPHCRNLGVIFDGSLSLHKHTKSNGSIMFIILYFKILDCSYPPNTWKLLFTPSSTGGKNKYLDYLSKSRYTTILCYK